MGRKKMIVSAHMRRDIAELSLLEIGSNKSVHLLWFQERMNTYISRHEPSTSKVLSILVGWSSSSPSRHCWTIHACLFEENDTLRVLWYGLQLIILRCRFPLLMIFVDLRRKWTVSSIDNDCKKRYCDSQSNCLKGRNCSILQRNWSVYMQSNQIRWRDVNPIRSHPSIS